MFTVCRIRAEWIEHFPSPPSNNTKRHCSCGSSLRKCNDWLTLHSFTSEITHIPTGHLNISFYPCQNCTVGREWGCLPQAAQQCWQCFNMGGRATVADAAVLLCSYGGIRRLIFAWTKWTWGPTHCLETTQQITAGINGSWIWGSTQCQSLLWGFSTA